MATVYLAHDLRHDRPVALKILHPELSAILGAERFQREIKTTARLDHPHILPVFDSGDTAGLLWYTMPYVEGESLRDRLRREVQLPFEEAVRLSNEVADALDYAHVRGIIHRDIKPENILLAGGHARVADFGVAKALAVGHEGQLTETGMSVGTPAYMSPEQASGGQVDGRSDIYALGCVLYEMLAGEPPFTGRTPQAVIAKRILEPVPHVRTLRESVSEDVERALLRALARTPADRFATAGEFVRGLSSPLETAVRTSPLPGRRRWIPAGLATMVLLGLGLLFVWRKIQGPDEAGRAEPKRLAVLPFENLGRPEDEYFADGVTDEVRGKLAALPGLQVIARGSSAQYKRTTKSARQVGRELGVQYLLTGTVRWEKGQGGQGRVRVSPELVQAATAATRWQQPFDAALTDVFQVQADIAGRVAQALGLALDAGERERLAERPTENLASYDAFLRGEQLVRGEDLGSHRRALPYYEQAVTLDSGFANAWAALSTVHTLIYQLGGSSTAEAEASRGAAMRALALAPDGAEGRLALGNYFLEVEGNDRQALEQFTTGLRAQPENARLLGATAWITADLQGWEAALNPLRQAEALDPRSASASRRVAYALLMLRRYTEAHDDADRALALLPDALGLIQTKAMIYLAQGDLPAARAVVRAALRRVDPAALVVYFGQIQDLYWMLEEPEQELLLRQPESAFSNDRGSWGLTLAETYALRGDQRRARAYADSARVSAEEQLQAMPGNAAHERVAERRTILALALAYLGRTREAVREGEHVVQLVPLAGHAENGPYVQHQLARIYLLGGQPERALDRLESLLKVPYYLSAGWLRIDPTFAPLHGNPRFERLLAGR
jgi:eukaryotic-like serine/threonine-protein kinase